MHSYYIGVFCLTVLALFLLFGLDRALSGAYKAQKSKKEKAASMKLRKRSIAAKIIQRQKELAAAARMPRSVYYTMTALGGAVGFALGKLFFSDTFVAVITGGLGAVSPLFVLALKITAAKSARADKLRSTMMILSNSYIVTEDFLKSVRDNVDALEYPQPFRDLLAYTTYIDNSVEKGLRRMNNQVDNSYFPQWVDALVMAQSDRSLKYVAKTVVDEMNDAHEVQRESDTAMFAIWREYFTLLILIFSVPMIFRVLMNPAYVILVTSPIGKLLILLLLAAVVFSVVKAMKVNKPLLM